MSIGFPLSNTASIAVDIKARNSSQTLLRCRNSSGSTVFSVTNAGNQSLSVTHTSETSKALSITATSSSTSGSTSYEPVLVSTTLTGAGQVGGRARFFMTTNVALGSWSNALKGEVTYGASGRTAGLGSAILAEMTLSAGTSAGTYAPLEIELNLGTGALTGTQTSLIYMSVNGDDASTFDGAGEIFTIAGLTPAGDATSAISSTSLAELPASSIGLRIKVGSSYYYIPAVAEAEWN